MTPKFRALILTAIPIEFAAISEYLSDIKNEDNKYDIGIISLNNICWEIVLVETDMLNAAAGIETTQGIIKYNPDIVLFVGIAGGIKKVSHGDLVCPQKVIGYESGKADDDYKLRLEEYRPKDDMHRIPLLEKIFHSPKEKVLINISFYQFLSFLLSSLRAIRSIFFILWFMLSS